MRFFIKRVKKGIKCYKSTKKGKIYENLGKNVQNILKKDRLLRAILGCNKLLENDLTLNLIKYKLSGDFYLLLGRCTFYSWVM